MPTSRSRWRRCGPTRPRWSCRRRAWGRDLAPPLASHPNPKDQPTTFCAARRIRPEVGNFLTGKACIALPEDRSLPGQRRGLPLQALASVAPTAQPEQSPLWRHLYRLSNLDRRHGAKSPFEPAPSSRKRASGAPVPGREPIVVNRPNRPGAGAEPCGRHPPRSQEIMGLARQRRRRGGAIAGMHALEACALERTRNPGRR